MDRRYLRKRLLEKFNGLFCFKKMYKAYVLYPGKYGKIYIGYTGNPEPYLPVVLSYRIKCVNDFAVGNCFARMLDI